MKTPVLKSLIKKRLHHRCFPLNIATFLRISIFKNICEWLLPTFAADHLTINLLKNEKISPKPIKYNGQKQHIKLTCQITEVI